jgi:SpoVK/Ycf46/Vps4 family AAA+-type ATPase
MSANRIDRLPPELSRAERFDGVFFCDLPDESERNTIWQIYLRRYRLDPEQARPCDEGWTGAEIKSCCRLASLLDLPLLEAAEQVVPVSVTAAEQVQALRNWASGRCLSTEHQGLYRGPNAKAAEAATQATTRRRVRRNNTNDN